uniref:Uncharacterized protein n=1 Tax=Opuntia streptacantha TaxID=393608 RepID=A0A7C9A5X1_OPUST
MVDFWVIMEGLCAQRRRLLGLGVGLGCRGERAMFLCFLLGFILIRFLGMIQRAILLRFCQQCFHLWWLPPPSLPYLSPPLLPGCQKNCMLLHLVGSCYLLVSVYPSVILHWYFKGHCHFPLGLLRNMF